MRYFLGFFFFFSGVGVVAQLPLKFIEEYIDFKLDENYFEINGVYLFNNPNEKSMKTSIQFPFATQADSLEVLRVFDLNKNKNLKYYARDKSIYFMIDIAGRDTLSINIAYKQPKKRENIYILTSTQAWEAPLQKANYSFYAKEDIVIQGFSYEYDSISENKIYKWEKTDFMPDKNFIVRISETQ